LYFENKTQFLYSNDVSIGLALFFNGFSQNPNLIWADTIVDTIPVGQGPVALAFNPENENMYVADFNSGNVAVIDSSSNTIDETIPVGQGPVALEYNPNNDNIYVANENSGSVSVIETE
jgi:YVTN family beta-propeller protein